MHSASTDVLVAARGLALGYGGEPVVAGVSLEIRAGEAWCLMGPNGCGKSTLLRGLLGLLAPQAGTLELAPRLRDHAGVGYVPQRSELNGALPTTVQELVVLGLVGSSVPRAARARAAAAALEEVGIGALASRSFWALSGGQRQRALLARALARQPELLVLDEPTEGLDVGTEAALRALLGRLRASGRLTLILVTHRPELARAHADHVALFAEGRVVTGPRETVLG